MSKSQMSLNPGAVNKPGHLFTKQITRETNKQSWHKFHMNYDTWNYNANATQRYTKNANILLWQMKPKPKHGQLQHVIVILRFPNSQFRLSHMLHDSSINMKYAAGQKSRAIDRRIESAIAFTNCLIASHLFSCQIEARTCQWPKRVSAKDPISWMGQEINKHSEILLPRACFSV